MYAAVAPHPVPATRPAASGRMWVLKSMPCNLPLAALKPRPERGVMVGAAKAGLQVRTAVCARSLVISLFKCNARIDCPEADFVLPDAEC